MNHTYCEAEPSKVDKMFGITDDHKNRWNDWLVNNSAKVLFVLLVLAINVVVIAERLHCEHSICPSSDLISRLPQRRGKKVYRRRWLWYPNRQGQRSRY